MIVQMLQTLSLWSLAPITFLAEPGDISRFDNQMELMAFLGLLPSEHSMGKSCRQGAITQTGIGHARSMLMEWAWNNRFPVRQIIYVCMFEFNG